MKNFLESGDTAVVPAPANVVSGQFIVVGALFGVCMNDALSTVDVVIKREGVYELPKETGTAWSRGDVLYWDSANARFTKTAAANLPLGVAHADALSADALGNVAIEAIQEAVGKVVAGEAALDGSNPTPIVTGLTTIVSVELALKKNTAPGLGTSSLTYDTTGGTVNVYGWKPTGAGDCTLIASTGTETFAYVVRGS
jgi:predicted RecA/RadA family phage recombinase